MEKVADADVAAAERELGYQTLKKDLKCLFHQSDFESGGDKRCKKLYVMYGGSSELVSWRDVKTLCQEVFSIMPGHRKRHPTNGGGAPPSPQTIRLLGEHGRG
jgi:hypothetical protein